MRTHRSTTLALALTLAGCGASTPASRGPGPEAPTTQAAPRHGLQIRLVTVYVDDQDKALRFYTDVLGFAKHDDFSSSGYRWLTVRSPGDPNGSELLLAANRDPAAKAFQQAMFAQRQPAIMFHTDDVARDYERIKAQGGAFTMPPTDVTASTIATLDDTCGNLVQLTQLKR